MHPWAAMFDSNFNPNFDNLLILYRYVLICYEISNIGQKLNTFLQVVGETFVRYQCAADLA